MEHFARFAPRFSHSLALLSKIDFSGLSPRSLARAFSRGRSYERSIRYDINSFQRRPPNKVSYYSFFDRPRYPAFSPRRAPRWPRFQRGGLVWSFGVLDLFGWAQTDYFRVGRSRLKWRGWHEKRRIRGRLAYARSYGSARFSFYYRHRRFYRRRRRVLVAIRRAKWGRPMLRRVKALLPYRSFSVFSNVSRRLSSIIQPQTRCRLSLGAAPTMRLSSMVSRAVYSALSYDRQAVRHFSYPQQQVLPSNRSYFRLRSIAPWRRRLYRWRYKPRPARYNWFYARRYRRSVAHVLARRIRQKLFSAVPGLRAKLKKIRKSQKARRPTRARRFPKFRGPSLQHLTPKKRKLTLHRRALKSINRIFSFSRSTAHQTHRPKTPQVKSGGRKTPQVKSGGRKTPQVKSGGRKRSKSARRRRSRRRARHRHRWGLNKVPRNREPKQRALLNSKKADHSAGQGISFTGGPSFRHPQRSLRRRWASSRKRRHPARRLLNRLYPFVKALRLSFWRSHLIFGLRGLRLKARRSRALRRWVSRLRSFRAFSRSLHKQFKFRFLYRFSAQLRASVFYHLRRTTALIRSRHVTVMLLRFLGIFLRSIQGGEPVFTPGRNLRQQRLSFLASDVLAFYCPLAVSWAKVYGATSLFSFLHTSFSLIHSGSLGLLSPYWATALGNVVRTQSEVFVPISLSSSRFMRKFGASWPSISRFAGLKFSVAQWLFAASCRLTQRRKLRSRFLLPMLFALRHRPGTLRLASSNLFNFTLYDHSYIHYSVGRYKRLKNKRRARFRLR